jgi:SAM-dependent methyltransferase
MEASTRHDPSGHRLYRDLAPWWPLLSPVDQYEEEAAFVATLLHSAGIGVRDVLELGSGGGHNAAHLSRHFTMTLVDLSPDMLALSRGLNPHCRHLVGDMRVVRLGETFDAVFVHDAVDYVVTVDDLRAVATTAFTHCRPGGMAVFVPAHVRETFTDGTECGGTDAADGRSARYHSWTWDPDPADCWILTTYALVLRTPDGRVDLAQETHRTGLFARAVWLDALHEAGFEASALEDEGDDDRPPRIVFVGHRSRT